MKIKKSYIVGAVIVVLLAIFIVMGVTNPDNHAGHDHATQTTADAHAGHDHATATQPNGPTGADLTPDKSFTITDNKDGTYTVIVKGRSGSEIYNEKLSVKPTFTEVSQDVLEIAYRTGDNTVGHWAVYCDIQNHRVSKTYNFVLAANNDHVAYVEHISGKFTLFVADAFDDAKYLKSYDLPDIALTESGSPKVTYNLKNADLTVTYSTEKGDNTITVNMFD